MTYSQTTKFHYFMKFKLIQIIVIHKRIKKNNTERLIVTNSKKKNTAITNYKCIFYVYP